MKLKDNFFLVKSFSKTETGLEYTIELNPEHFVYQAHFPENPITPGVCIIQIIKELTIETLNRNLFLKKIHNVKFLYVINPLENKEVVCSISLISEDDSTHKVSAVVNHGDQLFAKLSLLFINQKYH